MFKNSIVDHHGRPAGDSQKLYFYFGGAPLSFDDASLMRVEIDVWWTLMDHNFALRLLTGMRIHCLSVPPFQKPTDHSRLQKAILNSAGDR